MDAEVVCSLCFIDGSMYCDRCFLLGPRNEVCKAAVNIFALFFFFGQLVFCFLSLKNIPVKVRNVIIACTMKAEIYSCNSFSSSGGLSNVVKTDYFSNFATTIISRVNDFEVIDNYMFSTNSVCTL